MESHSLQSSPQEKGQYPAGKKSKIGLLIIAIIFGAGVLGSLCMLNFGFLIWDQSPTSTIVPSKTSSPKPFIGKWQVSTGKSEFDDSTTVVLSLEAEDFIEGWLTTTLPTLVLRCKEREMNVYVNVGTQSNVESGLDDAATVRVRFDRGQAFEMVASESTDGEALFFRDPYGMIIAMLQSKEMVFGFTPFNADPAVTTFDLRGLSNAIEPLKQSCNWNGARPTLPPLPTLIPSATATVTSTPLPLGSSLTIHGLSAGDWNVEIERVVVTKSVSSFGSTTTAGGQFVLVFLNVTNIGNDPRMFSGTGEVQVKDAEGNTFGQEPIASLKAADSYGVKYGSMIQPGEATTRLLAFDLPLTSAFYFLVPGTLADSNGQSIVLEIPK
jgi:type VI secretion system protein VasI